MCAYRLWVGVMGSTSREPSSDGLAILIVCPLQPLLAHDSCPGDGEEGELKKIVEPTSCISVHRLSVHITLNNHVVLLVGFRLGLGGRP